MYTEARQRVPSNQTSAENGRRPTNVSNHIQRASHMQRHSKGTTNHQGTWETYIVNNPPDSMWGNSKQADHDQALSSSTTPTMKQESKEEALSDLTDNLSSLGTKQADHD